MNWRLEAKHTPIAIDIQADQIFAAQFSRCGDKWTRTLTVSMRRELGVGAAAAALSDQELASLERSLHRQGAIGRAIVLLAPPAAAHTELLELPPRGPQTPIAQLARAELGRLSRLEEAFQITTWDVPPPLRRGTSDVRTATSLYAVALPEAAVVPCIEQFAAQGRSVRYIVPSPIAAARAATRGSAVPHDAATVVVDISWDRAALTIVKAGLPIYHRDLSDNGLSLLARGLTAELHLSEKDAANALVFGSLEVGSSKSRASALCESFAEALANELEVSIAFASRRYGDQPILTLMLVGAGARVQGLGDWLRDRLEIAREEAKPFGTPTGDEQAICEALAFSTNLSATELLPAAQKEFCARERVAVRWLATAAAVVACGVAGVGALYASNSSSTTADESRLRGIQHDQTRLDAEAADATAKLASVKLFAAFDDRLGHQPDYGLALRILSKTIDPSTVLHDIAMTAPAPTAANAKSTALRKLKLSGTAQDSATLTRQVEAFRAIDIFSNVELARTSRSADGKGVTFDLSLDIVVPRAAGGRP